MSETCRFCATPLEHSFVDLGASPPCQRHVTPGGLDRGEARAAGAAAAGALS